MTGQTTPRNAPENGAPNGRDPRRPANPSRLGSGETETPVPSDPGRRLVYLAAERTLLSWVRVAIALVVLGFAVDRFGLLLAQRGPVGELGVSWSSWLGIALIASGIATSIAAAIHYRRFLRRDRQGDTRPGAGISLAVGLALLLSVVGVAMAIYLYEAAAHGWAARPRSGTDAAAPAAAPHERNESRGTG